jgi:hypothetical protein
MASPTRFHDTGDLPPKAEKSEANAAELELAEEPSDPAAIGATVIHPSGELRGLFHF